MKTGIHPAYSGREIEAFLKRLPTVFDDEGEMLYNKRNQVKRFVLPSGRPVVVKRFKKPILIQRIIYGFFSITAITYGRFACTSAENRSCHGRIRPSPYLNLFRSAFRLCLRSS